MYRTKNANFSFKKLKNTNETVSDSWRSFVMPLPYAFQGRCMLPEIYTLDSSNTIISGNEEASEYQNKMKEISESKAYKEFVNEKLMAAELATSLLDNL